MSTLNCCKTTSFQAIQSSEEAAENHFCALGLRYVFERRRLRSVFEKSVSNKSTTITVPNII